MMIYYNPMKNVDYGHVKEEAARAEQTSLLCSLMERYLVLNPSQNIAEAIYQVTTVGGCPLMYGNNRERILRLTNGEIIKGFQVWLARYDSGWENSNA